MDDTTNRAAEAGRECARIAIEQHGRSSYPMSEKHQEGDWNHLCEQLGTREISDEDRREFCAAFRTAVRAYNRTRLDDYDRQRHEDRGE